MKNKEYIEMLYIFNYAFDNKKVLIITWPNSLEVKCKSHTGVYETDIEYGEEDYVGEYAAGINEVIILTHGKDNSIVIYDGSIEISLASIPKKITLENGTVLWEQAAISPQ